MNHGCVLLLFFNTALQVRVPVTILTKPVTMKQSLLAFLLLCSSAAFAGGGYKLYLTHQGMEVYGKWKYEKPFKKGKMVLCIKVVNITSSAQVMSMDVNFYDVAVLSETSSIDSLCVPAGKRKRGGKYGLCMVSERFSNEQLMDAAFHWRIEDVAVAAVADCEM